MYASRCWKRIPQVLNQSLIQTRRHVPTSLSNIQALSSFQCNLRNFSSSNFTSSKSLNGDFSTVACNNDLENQITNENEDASTVGFTEQRPIELFDLSEKVFTNLKKVGITHLFPVQVQSYATMMSGNDLMGRSKTGSGKTLAFALPIVQKILEENRTRRDKLPRALVLLPTRELSQQVASEFERIAPQLRVSNIVGGVSYTTQENELRRGVDVLVGTPGRIIDQLDRGNIDLSMVTTTVLDEADMMLKVGFQEAVEQIFESVPEERQSVLWSATFPKWVSEMSKRFLNEPEWIDLVGDDETHMPKTVTHRAINADTRHRAKILSSVLDVHSNNGQALVFTETKKEVDELRNAINRSDCRVLHGDLSQASRTSTLEGFRSGQFKTLICTDVAARGLDISSVELVVHYRLPSDQENFVHRSGRTGRAGRSGVNIVLFDDQDISQLRNFERDYGLSFIHTSAPSVSELIHHAGNLAEEALNQVSIKSSEPFNDIAEQLLEQHGVQALSSALAIISGYQKQHPQQFSMLTGFPRKQTVRVEGMPVHNALRILNKELNGQTLSSSDVVSTSRNEFLTDLPYESVDEILSKFTDDNSITIEKVNELPEVQIKQKRGRNYGRNNYGGNQYGTRNRYNDRSRGNKYSRGRKFENDRYGGNSYNRSSSRNRRDSHDRLDRFDKHFQNSRRRERW